MKRRDFFKRAGIGSAALVSAPAIAGDRAAAAPPDDHRHEPLRGPLASAVVSFGQWKIDPPLNRYPNIPPAPAANNHQLFPFEAIVRKGGGVMFVISGLHQVIVYDDGMEPADIAIGVTVPTTGVPAGVPLIDFGNGRLYRGPDPSLMPMLDRTETVHFPRRGRFLVICGVLPHFVDDNMHGYVRVV